MTKGKAKIELSDILTKLEMKDIDFCIAGRDMAKVLDKIYASVCQDDCTEELNPCNNICP